MKLWDGKPQTQDKVLLGLMIGLPLLLTLTIPLRPLLIADQPVLLAAITGSYAAIGAGGAYDAETERLAAGNTPGTDAQSDSQVGPAATSETEQNVPDAPSDTLTSKDA